MGSLYVPFGNPVWKVVKVRTCTTAETCAGSSDERVTMIAYDNPNLKPSSITVIVRVIRGAVFMCIIVCISNLIGNFHPQKKYRQ